jgi:hypothetical protein
MALISELVAETDELQLCVEPQLLTADCRNDPMLLLIAIPIG